MANAPRKMLTILSWNVRGLNDKDKCAALKLDLPNPLPSIICLQETKLHSIPFFKALSFLPPTMHNSFWFKPAEGTSGGILTAWDPSAFDLVSSLATAHTLSTHLTSRRTNLSFLLTNVYGSCHDPAKPAFLDELTPLAESHVSSVPWCLLGDFNLIRYPEECLNDNFDIQEAELFNSTIHDLSLQELSLLDRPFTWSNHQVTPILAKLDRFLVTTNWNLALPNSSISSFSSRLSDHAPLLTASTDIPRSPVFRYNNH